MEEKQYGESIGKTVTILLSTHWKSWKRNDFWIPYPAYIRGTSHYLHVLSLTCLMIKCMRSMGHCKVVRSHFGLEEIWLWDHSIDVDFHNILHKLLIVQGPIGSVLIKEDSHLILLEAAAKLVQTFLESSKFSISGISQIEIGQGFLSCLPFVGLAVTF